MACNDFPLFALDVLPVVFSPFCSYGGPLVASYTQRSTCRFERYRRGSTFEARGLSNSTSMGISKVQPVRMVRKGERAQSFFMPAGGQGGKLYRKVESTPTLAYVPMIMNAKSISAGALKGPRSPWERCRTAES